jgi:hypothetical protein
MTKKNGNFTYDDSVSLVKHYNEVIGLLKELFLKEVLHIFSTIERDRETSQRALDLFDSKNNAHLAMLNGETARAAAVAAEFKVILEGLVTREMYDIQTKDFQRQIDELKQNRTGLEGEKKGRADFWGWVVGAVSFIGMIAALLDKIP